MSLDVVSGYYLYPLVPSVKFELHCLKLHKFSSILGGKQIFNVEYKLGAQNKCELILQPEKAGGKKKKRN